MKLRVLTVLLCLLAAGTAQAEGNLQVRDAWVRAIPPGATITAGYATLSNDGDAPVTILTAQSDTFRSVTLHETLVSDGVAKMREIHRLVVAPGATVKLEPGGRHLMMMSPRKVPAVGDKVGVTLLLRDGKRIDTYFDVIAPGADDGD
ncbi:MAG: copper chaperone PCu(A)C [Dokdonella sp.]|uniref:copper chaperone PCu(A)C n=1 Tax=Dokdonella sp. TaxID=2291710 RepID=UPI0025BA308F|nr:copper chaperone PCu(A)C [Dokdonella sp.]MBZ0222732.1 copper chaperone PCu(A)C [Dokdonella sp.]MCC7256166.1 copper chaperone PCu(A)C [Dokdonella sp.]